MVEKTVSTLQFSHISFISLIIEISEKIFMFHICLFDEITNTSTCTGMSMSFHLSSCLLSEPSDMLSGRMKDWISIRDWSVKLRDICTLVSIHVILSTCTWTLMTVKVDLVWFFFVYTVSRPRSKRVMVTVTVETADTFSNGG